MFRNMLKFPGAMYPVFMHFVCWLNDGSYLPVMHPYTYGGDVKTERMLFGASDTDDSSITGDVEEGVGSTRICFETYDEMFRYLVVRKWAQARREHKENVYSEWLVKMQRKYAEDQARFAMGRDSPSDSTEIMDIIDVDALPSDGGSICSSVSAYIEDTESDNESDNSELDALAAMI